MIIKCMKPRADPGGTMRYLLSEKVQKGLDEELHLHTDCRTVGGTAQFPGLEGRELAQALSDHLRFPALNAGLGGRVKAYEHIVFSLSATETAARGGGLTDAQWDALTRDYLREMGWQDATYTVVQHGHSAAGNDHVHMVLSTALPDGRRLDTGFSGKRSQKAATVLEQRHGLDVLQSRQEGVSARALTPGEHGMARRTGTPAPRQQLAGTLRAAATAAQTEAEYVRRLRDAGLTVRPRIDKTNGLVTGYSVAGPGGAPFSGGRIARDLSLPALRERAGWSDTAQDRAAAAAEWRGRAAPVVNTAGPPPVDVDRLTRELRTAGARWRWLSPQDRARYAGELSGALAAAGKHKEAREVGRWAQTRRPAGRRPGPSPFKTAAAGLLSQGMTPQEREMLRAVQQLLLALAQAHRSNHTTPRRPAPSRPAEPALDALRRQMHPAAALRRDAVQRARAGR